MISEQKHDGRTALEQILRDCLGMAHPLHDEASEELNDLRNALSELVAQADRLNLEGVFWDNAREALKRS